MKNNKSYWGWWALFSLVFMLIILYCNYHYANKIAGISNNANEKGLFGDMFGASNALFTGLSFTALIITILLQRKDINNQRQESNIQSFENTFFNLLNYHRERVDNLERNKFHRRITATETIEREIKIRGVKVFAHIYYTYIENLSSYKIFNNELYIKAYKTNRDLLGHYFKGIENILYNINELDASIAYKMRYVDILKSQLTDYELVLIFYHFLIDKESGYKIMSEKYAFFEFINLDLIKLDKDLYNRTAYKIN